MSVMHYIVEFMKFLCGFSLIIALSLVLLYFSAAGAETAIVAFPTFFA
jgi:hypothetical protein